MTPGPVRVFSVDLDRTASEVEQLDALLAPDEQDAPARVRVARASTRLVLAAVLDVDPRALSIARTCEHCGDPTHGRPTLAGGDGLSFSLSHSGSFAVIAVADGDVRVGVDVEEVRPRVRLDALAARVLNDDEHAAWLATDDADERLVAFLRAWTAKEAYLKALGIGIATRLRDVPARVAGWRTSELSLGAGRVAALAVDRADLAVAPVAPAPLVTSNGGTAG